MTYIGRLPRATTDVWDWQMQAACRGMASSLFFHPWGERGPGRVERVHQAKQICAQCPVIDPCRQHALQTHETYGVWGGLSEEERLLIHRPSLRQALAACRLGDTLVVTGDGTTARPDRPEQPGQEQSGQNRVSVARSGR